MKSANYLGDIAGSYGIYHLKGLNSSVTLLMTYRPSISEVSKVYNRCLGITSLEDRVCGHKVVVQVSAGLDSPRGCYCDCCGTNGEFSPPSLAINASDITASFGNTASIGTVTADEACKDGSLTGTFFCNNGGSEPVNWTTNGYQSDGTTRLYQGTGTIGSADNPAAAGGYVEYYATDGCGGSATITKTIGGGISTGPTIDPPGTSMTVGNSYTVEGYEAAVNATDAALDFTNVGSCLKDTFGDLVRDEANGKLKRNTGTLALVAGECNRCCGNGELYVYFNNGGGGDTNKTYYVRKSYGAGTIGKAFRCYDDGGTYKVQQADYDCSGSIGTWTDEGTTASSMADCIALIDDSTDTIPSNVCSAESCCYFSKNNDGDAAFRSYAVSVSGTTCCNIVTTNGSWVKDDGNCCPN
jgi:hypothetical protein